MDISLTKAGLNEAGLIHDLQIKSFRSLLDKYQDFETSPGNEPIEKVIERLKQPFTDYYLVKTGALVIGGIRIVKLGNGRYRVSPVFVLPEYQGQGVAQKVFKMVEEIYRDARVWELNTIQQEAGNCYLYEKLGYRLTGWTQIVNSKMTLIAYEKWLTG
jgi:GNAT superfamily N-acetyltransferase